MAKCSWGADLVIKQENKTTVTLLAGHILSLRQQIAHKPQREYSGQSPMYVLVHSYINASTIATLVEAETRDER